MKILVLQLKRIGDLVLTTPALTALKAWRPNCHVAIGVHVGTSGLLPLVPHFDSAIVFGRGRGWAPWQQVLTGRFDAVLDFTGTDRSAAVAWLSRASRRVTFEWVKKKGLRRLAYTEFVKSSVRERHTIDHYLDLVQVLTGTQAVPAEPELGLPQESRDEGKGYVVVHPFTARPEKNWPPGSWGEVISHCTKRGLRCVLTGGGSAEEKEHHGRIIAAAKDCEVESLAGETDLLRLCELIAGAALVISGDTAAVHLAAAYQRPQIALYGPTNPFHWRPRHEQALVISAAEPDAPMNSFDPRMKGAPMDRISTGTVCRAIDALLA